MKKHFDLQNEEKLTELRTMVIGLGERSGRKTYYPELRRRLRELKVAKNRAEAADRAKSEFLANMSHEIRSPLNTVLGFTELLSETTLTENQREHLERIKNAGTNLRNLINDILDISKIEAGHLKLELIDFDLRALLDELTGGFEKTAAEKGLQLKVTTPAGLPRNLRGDPLRIRQVLTNLLSNAIKFTGKGSISLQLSVLKKDLNSCCLLFEVTDTGIGIPPERLKDLFGRFVQLDSSVTRQYGGSGLGLHITKQLVQMMGGQIWATSTVGAGSTFRVQLPFDLAQQVVVPPERIAPNTLPFL